MSNKSKALRLAEWIESDMTCQGDAEIAAELRRQHALIAELQQALQMLVTRVKSGYDGLPQGEGLRRAEEALAKVEAQQ